MYYNQRNTNFVIIMPQLTEVFSNIDTLTVQGNWIGFKEAVIKLDDSKFTVQHLRLGEYSGILPDIAENLKTFQSLSMILDDNMQWITQFPHLTTLDLKLCLHLRQLKVPFQIFNRVTHLSLSVLDVSPYDYESKALVQYYLGFLERFPHQNLISLTLKDCIEP